MLGRQVVQLEPGGGQEECNLPVQLGYETVSSPQWEARGLDMIELRPVRESPGLWSLLSELGMDATQLMGTLSAATWHRVRAEVQRHRYETFMDTIIRNPHMRGFPIRAAQQIKLSDWHVLGVAAASASTVAEGIDLAVRYKRVWTRADLAFIERDVKRNVLRVEYFPINGKSLGTCCHIEFSVATLVQLARDLARTKVRPHFVEFRHDAPLNIDEHQAFFNAPIHYRAHCDAIEFDLDSMDEPISTADATVEQLAVDYLEAVMQYHTPETADLEHQVFRAVEKQLGEGIPKIDVVAQRLGIGERTLQRRLQNSGLSYYDIVDSARKNLACKLMRTTDLSLTDIALMVGFSETSAFSRAFKRWSGESPSVYRRQTNL